jgi:beta-lactamase regulating signal transducer with metallopeptidase domain
VNTAHLDSRLRENDVGASGKNIDWQTTLLHLYFAGMAITLLLAAWGYIRILLCLRKAEPAEDALAEPWRNLLTQHGIDARSIPMLLSKDLGPALVQTPLGARLVVPSELWSELSASGRLGILKHELAHFRRRDVGKSFFVRMLTLPHWFNPMAHYAANRFDELAEQLCDREAFLSETQSGQQEGISEFAEVLLLLHENAPAHFVVRHSIFGRNLKRRVAFLQQSPSPERNFTMRKTLLVLGAVAILAVAVLRVEFVEKSEAQVPPQSPQRLQGTESEQSAAVGQTVGKTVKVHGRVTDPSGKPVEGALLVWDTTSDAGTRRENRQKSVRSDKEGRYESPPLPAMKGSITVIAEGYAPDMKSVDFANLNGSVNFTLQKGNLLQIRFVDQQGKPIPDVEVSIGDLPIQPWRVGANIFTGNPRYSDGPLTGIPTKSDGTGLYRWTWAPPDQIGFMFKKPVMKR